jgi:hypothetical protein
MHEVPSENAVDRVTSPLLVGDPERRCYVPSSIVTMATPARSLIVNPGLSAKGGRKYRKEDAINVCERDRKTNVFDWRGTTLRVLSASSVSFTTQRVIPRQPRRHWSGSHRLDSPHAPRFRRLIADFRRNSTTSEPTIDNDRARVYVNRRTLTVDFSVFPFWSVYSPLSPDKAGMMKLSIVLDQPGTVRMDERTRAVSKNAGDSVNDSSLSIIQRQRISVNKKTSYHDWNFISTISENQYFFLFLFFIYQPCVSAGSTASVITHVFRSLNNPFLISAPFKITRFVASFLSWTASTAGLCQFAKWRNAVASG